MAIPVELTQIPGIEVTEVGGLIKVKAPDFNTSWVRNPTRRFWELSQVFSTQPTRSAHFTLRYKIHQALNSRRFIYA